jgi:hypothetical protein
MHVMLVVAEVGDGCAHRVAFALRMDIEFEGCQHFQPALATIRFVIVPPTLLPSCASRDSSPLQNCSVNRSRMMALTLSADHTPPGVGDQPPKATRMSGLSRIPPEREAKCPPVELPSLSEVCPHVAGENEWSPV